MREKKGTEIRKGKREKIRKKIEREGRKEKENWKWGKEKEKKRVK